MTTSLLSLPVSRRAVLTSTVGMAVFSVPDAFLDSLATPGASSPLEDTLRETEERRLRYLVDFDREVANSLHADDFQLISPIGADLSKRDYLSGLGSGFLDYVTFEPVSEIDVRLFGDAAALRYRSEIEIHVGDDLVDRGKFWHTDVYELRDDQWQVVWSQATKII